jgi:hypothetical protein
MLSGVQQSIMLLRKLERKYALLLYIATFITIIVSSTCGALTCCATQRVTGSACTQSLSSVVLSLRMTLQTTIDTTIVST